MSTDDAFEPYWLDETDWLVTLCVMLEDEDDLTELNWIGRLMTLQISPSVSERPCH